MFGLIKSILATVFLFLFLFVATLWVRSYFVCELYQHTLTTNENLAFSREIFGIASGRGGVYLITAHTTWAEPNRRLADDQIRQIKNGWARTVPQNPAYGGGYFNTSRHGTRAGFGYGSANDSNNVSTVASTSFVFPYACPTFGLGLVSWGLINHCRTQRRQRRFVQSPEFADNDYLRPREAA